MNPRCQHCHEYPAVVVKATGRTSKRGLCWSCYQNLEIRDLYPPNRACGRPPEKYDPDNETADMTTEELEEFIEANRATMPVSLLEQPKSPEVGMAFYRGRSYR